jgi:hypothetical protein
MRTTLFQLRPVAQIGRAILSTPTLLWRSGISSTLRQPSPLDVLHNSSVRSFSTSPVRAGTWLLPTQPEKKRSRKGRPRVPTGGSSRGTTVIWGDYGLRMCDHHRRVSAAQLKIGEDAIKQRLRGMRYRLYTRISASIGVYKSGNEVSNLHLDLRYYDILTPSSSVWVKERVVSIIGHRG